MESVKRKRIVDQKLLAEVRRLPCLGCSSTKTLREIQEAMAWQNNKSDAHHCKTVASGGDDIATNLLPVCRAHHREIHTIGIKAMRAKYKLVDQWFKEAGWGE